MKRNTLVTGMVLAFTLAAAAALADPPACPGTPNIGCIWKNENPVFVQFNATLDPDLEQVRLYLDNANNQQKYTLGDANTRWLCFQQAVAAWNAVLDTLCNGKPSIHLQAVQNNTAWAADQAAQKCTDAGLANPDNPALPHLPATGDGVFDRAANYLNDGTHSTSTARGDKKMPPVDPGWVVGDMTGSYDIDARLGETYGQCASPDNSKIQDADILWFTHLPGTPSCTVIPWDYRFVPNGADPNDPGAPVPYKGAGGKPGPDAYDFYSVMLHELGHVLGLGHMTDPAGGNVMIGQLFPGDRQKISATEIACLKQLYCPQATPAQHETWGELKTHYR